ncbi:MAG: serine/threonine protein kinase [Vicinamibacteria bacterium]|nr:serine/threonine protein kinase [Vicinamibacteria bacterium]
MSLGPVPPADGNETDSVTPADLEGISAPTLPEGTLVDGRYRVGAVLGSGGYAVVYRAVDETSGAVVALKLLRPDRVSPVAIRRLQREAQSAVDHPALVPVFDQGIAPEGPFLVMELVEGETLRERLKAGLPPVAAAIAMALAVADALQALHDAGLVHRDLKPSNILLGRDGGVRIADLGLVTALEADEETRVTRADGLVGTMEYISPEQALGQDVDNRSDLYSLGIVLFEMLAGQLPFSARSSLGSVLARVTTEPPPLSDSRPDAPAWLVAIVRQLLARDPAHRYSSARDVAADLRTQRAPEGHEATAQPQAARRLWALGLALILLAVVGSGFALRRGAVDPRARQLAMADVVGGVLRARDASGEVLWVHRFATSLPDKQYALPSDGASGARLVVHEVDGQPEVWLLGPDSRQRPGLLLVFTAAGRLRVQRELGRPVTFGDERYERFVGNALYTVTDERGRRRLFLTAAHQPWFPSVLAELGPDGSAVSEFWAPGHMLRLNRIRFARRDALALGGFNNESRGAGLAILDLAAPTGRMPAEKHAYRCSDCGSRDPLAAIVLPSSDVLRSLQNGQGSARVMDSLETEAGLAVSVAHGGIESELSSETREISVRYELDPTLRRVVRITPDGLLFEAHARLHKAGQLDHAFGPGDLRELARVKRWDGTRYVELEADPALFR